LKKILIYLSFSLLLLSGCGAVNLESSNLDREIYIDGSAAEWQGKLIYLEKQNISIGLMNDDDFLYACMVIGDTRLQNRIIHSGLELWFDDVHAKAKKIGIRYPIGNRKSIRARREIYGESIQSQDFSSLDNGEVEIINSDNEILDRLPVTALNGLEVKINNEEGRLVYELKLPLKDQKDYSISLPITKDSELVMDLVLNGISAGSQGRGVQGSRRGGGSKGGGMRGGGRGGAGGNMSMMRDETNSILPQFKINAKIKLAGF